MSDPAVLRDWAHFLKNIHKTCIGIFSGMKLIQSDKTKKGDGSKFTRSSVHHIADRIQTAMRYTVYRIHRTIRHINYMI